MKILIKGMYMVSVNDTKLICTIMYKRWQLKIKLCQVKTTKHVYTHLG